MAGDICLLTLKPGLAHQKAFKPQDNESGEWYLRGVKTFQATKFRKGACENCGAMTHKRKDCVERPRKKNAEKTSRNIAADEYVHDTKGVALNWDGKRDRYNGFDAEDYGHGLTLVHFSAQPEPFLTQHTPQKPPDKPSHPINTI